MKSTPRVKKTRAKQESQGLKRHEYTHRPKDKPIFKALEAHSKAGTMPDISSFPFGQEGRGVNRYFLDAGYLGKNLVILLRDIENYKPEEMGRALRRLADAVDPITEILEAE